MVNQNWELVKRCAGNEGPSAKKGWHALVLTKSDGKNNAVALKSSMRRDLVGELTIVNAVKQQFLELNIMEALLTNYSLPASVAVDSLPFGTFINEFDSIAFAIIAMELGQAIKENQEGMKICKMTPIKPFMPVSANVPCFGVNCVDIAFPDDIGHFALNISASVYGVACGQFQRTSQIGQYPENDVETVAQEMADACAHVPTLYSSCDKNAHGWQFLRNALAPLVVCYKSEKRRRTVVGRANNGQLGTICQKRLGIDGAQFVPVGFRLRNCARREADKQLIIVQSILDFTFSDQSYINERNFSFKIGQISEALNKVPLLFIEFGNVHDQSAFKSAEEQNDDRNVFSADDLTKKTNLFGAILNDIIVNETDEGNWAKSLHFVPPSADAEHIEIFFEMANFARLITRNKLLRILTMNTWHAGSHLTDGLNKIVKHINALNADVVFLQEMDAESFEELLKKLGSKWSGQIHLQHVEAKPAIIIDGTMFHTNWTFGVTILLDDGMALNVVNVHLNYIEYGPYMVQNAKNKTEILAADFEEYGRFKNIIELSEHRSFKTFVAQASAGEVPLVLAGDFNGPSHLDWANETRHVHKNFVVKWPVTKYLSEKLGLIDSFRQLRPNVTAEPGYTWPCTGNVANEPSDRIDFIFYKCDRQQRMKPIQSFTYAGTDHMEKALHSSNGTNRQSDWISDHHVVVTDFVLYAPQKKLTKRPADKTPNRQSIDSAKKRRTKQKSDKIPTKTKKGFLATF
ncbi:hypothetical protein niasHS_009290 [Heterodera schachtii]|uniref:Endonuclease/exonuclease/phosphatase domain-containing protein n=1 Tax=Heterodera schachtii TaxID=97005 RepID=A0ABD2IX72_HETSC